MLHYSFLLFRLTFNSPVALSKTHSFTVRPEQQSNSGKVLVKGPSARSHLVRIKRVAVVLAVLASHCPYRHPFRCDSHCRRNKAWSLRVKAQQVNDTRICSLTDCTVCTNMLVYRSQSQWRPRSWMLHTHMLI